MITDILQKIVNRLHLTAEEAEAVMQEIMRGEAAEAQIGALLVALRMKGETAEEVAGFVRVMRAHCIPVRPRTPLVVDTCGTGGDLADTFNISTTAAFITAGAQVAVAKHGNRAVSSLSGSADVLKALGVEIELSPEAVARCIDEAGIGFLFAPGLHPAMKYAIGPRRQLAMRTVFNLLGPLTNPAGARRQVIGVYDPAVALLVAEALRRNDAEHVLVVHGRVGLDEIALCGETQVVELRDGEITVSTLTAHDLGLPEAAIDEIAGGDPETSARYLLEVLEGKPGARRNISLANAAAAIYVGGQAADLVEGVRLAEQSVDSGAAMRALENLRELTRTLA